MGEVRPENGKRNHRQPQTAADAAPAKKRRRSPWLSALQIATHGPDRYPEARNRSSSEESRFRRGVVLRLWAGQHETAYGSMREEPNVTRLAQYQGSK